MGRYGTTSLAGNSVSAHSTPNVHKGETHPGQGPPSEVHTTILAARGSAAQTPCIARMRVILAATQRDGSVRRAGPQVQEPRASLLFRPQVTNSFIFAWR